MMVKCIQYDHLYDQNINQQAFVLCNFAGDQRYARELVQEAKGVTDCPLNPSPNSKTLNYY